MKIFSVTTLLVILFVSTLAQHSSSITDPNNEDFEFETSDDELGSRSSNLIDWNTSNLKIQTEIGKLFNLNVPKNGNCTKYDAKIDDAEHYLPSWLVFDKTNAIFSGVPLKENIGKIRIHVRCLTRKNSKTFELETVPRSDVTIRKCTSEDVTFLTLIIDRKIETIKAKQRINAIKTISKFFAIPYSAFVLKSLENNNIRDHSIIISGIGNVHTRVSDSITALEVPVGCEGRLFHFASTLIHQLKRQSKDGTISELLRLPLISWNVNVKNDHRNKRQTTDLDGGSAYDGEYYDDYEDEPENDDENYDDDEGFNVNPNKPFGTTSTTKSYVTTHYVTVPTSSSSTTGLFENTSTHPHRHHHGEVKKDEIVPPDWSQVNEDNSLEFSTSSKVSESTSTTSQSTTRKPPTTTIKIQSTTTKLELPAIPETDYGDYKVENYEDVDDDDNDDLGEIESETFVPILHSTTKKPVSSTITSSSSTTTTTPMTTTVTLPTSTTSTPSTTLSTVPTTTTTPSTTTLSTSPTTTTTLPTTSTTTEEMIPTTVSESTSSSTTPTSTSLPITTTEIELTTQPQFTTITEEIHTSSTKLSTSTSAVQTTTQDEEEEEEREEFGAKNYPPYIENRLKRKYVIAGKIFRFVIPEDTFKDTEDNYDLKIEFLDGEERPIMSNSWCQFNPSRREIYGLPLDDHVSKWEYVIRATDKNGASVQDRLTIVVQQHKLERVFNHVFTLEMRVEKREEFRHYIDWSLKTLRALGRIFNTNMSEITVRKVEHNVQPVLFSWSNDSLPTNYCPKSEIETLFKMLTANDRGDPSRELNAAVSPELRIKKVLYHGKGVCEEINKPIAPPINFPPILRNPVNRINATVGELLIFKVPKDTFYDPEDLDTLSLNLTLLTADRQVIPQENWLQFDTKNREFYGIPRKAGRNEYQLVCIDSGGLIVTDSLEVVVYPSSRISHNVEFSMTIEIVYEKFMNNANLQRKFVEKLVDIFDDKNASHIHFLPFKQKHQSTVVTWYNKSLIEEKCPFDKIGHLESIIKNDQHGISNRVHAIMEPEFQISTIKVLPMANCKQHHHKPKYHQNVPSSKVPDDRIVIDESATQTSSTSNEYLLTFIIPVVVISIMTFCALLAACVLYRRRRTGKMNVVEEGRSSYGNKGIPVIFQEELDEKPETGTKSPAILKDEKPPLAPPEYSKSGSLKFNNDDSEPYHPPPPFTRNSDNGKQQRPKPAPTYRKPPPYVPP